MMKPRSLLFLLFLALSPSILRASPTIEGLPVGFKKYYENGYIEINCPGRGSAPCTIEVRTKFGLIRKHLDLAAYGYQQAWDPIGAFLDIRAKKMDKVGFYFLVDCSSEDYKFSQKSEDEIKCSAQGEIGKDGVVIRSIEITPLSGDDPVIYREVAPAN